MDTARGAPDGALVVPYLTLRQAIGWAGLLMPAAVRLGAYAFQGVASTESISAYYYTGMRDVFVATLVLVGALLACYRSPDPRDGVVATVAGAAAAGVALFPTDPTFAAQILARYPETASGRCYVSRGFLGYHFLFVAAFFALSFYLVYFRFPAFGAGPPTRQKLRRNAVYRWCGLAMLGAFAAIGGLALTERGASIFWPETVAVVAFAVAWLVKGQTVLKDEPAVA